MILETVDDLKKYVSVAQSFVFEDFEPYITKAVNAFTRKYVGDLHVFLKDEAPDTEPNYLVKNEAREHLRNAIANFGYFIYLPFASVMMDSSGLSVVANDQRKTPEWWQTKDIRRELLRSGHEAMDYLLEVLEKNPLVFVDWTTDFGTINKELLVYNTSIFNKYFNVFNSRQTFLALQPTIRQVEDQYLHTLLCPELIEALKAEVSGKLKIVKTNLHKAIVAFTVSKVANVGLFLLDENGLRVNFETLIDGKKESVGTGKTADQIEKLVNEQLANGTSYLTIVKETIQANLSEFDQCAYPLIQTPSTGSTYETYDTPGIFSM